MLSSARITTTSSRYRGISIITRRGSAKATLSLALDNSHRLTNDISCFPRRSYSTVPPQLNTLEFARKDSKQANMTKGVGFYSLKAELPGGKTYDFEELKGKVVLIVNVASKCGFTPQYKGLEALYKKYKDDGLVILGFPCNQFGGQEPGTDEEISSFCQFNHGVTFPLMKKSDVNGDNTNEVYKWLKDEKAGILGLTRIKWNFEKFLIDRNGNVVQRWASTTSPDAIDKEVEKLVKQKPEEKQPEASASA